jgi:hypothetical protein
MRKDQIITAALDPRKTNLGSVGVALAAAARKADKNAS